MNAIFNNFENVKPELSEEFKHDEFNAGFGLDFEDLSKQCLAIAAQHKSRAVIKAELISFILKNARTKINPHGFFASRCEHRNIVNKIRERWISKLTATDMKDIIALNSPAMECRAYDGTTDFGHTYPNFSDILSFGINGLINRLEAARKDLDKKHVSDGQSDEFYSCSIMELEALKVFIKRLGDEAKSLKDGHENMALLSQCLNNISENAPQNFYEALQLISIFYFVQTEIECTNVRSIGSLDQLLYPFYENDLKTGNFKKEEITELLKYFMYRFYAANIASNLPFALCGEDLYGNSLTNELSYLILDVYAGLDITSPKIHIKLSKSTPDDIVLKVVDLIKKGCSSFVFINHDAVYKALVKLGEHPQDAADYVLVGCYEPAAAGKEVPCTCSGRINLLKAVEYALNGGTDMITGKQAGAAVKAADRFNDFNEFCDAVKEQIKFFTSRTIELINSYERHYYELNPSALFSSTLKSCVDNGKDAYDGGAAYNNSSICALGLSNAADALYTIKKIVFENKELSLSQLRDILANNWEGQQKLRLRIKALLPKYGNNASEVDDIAVSLAEFTSSNINKRPNGRGGVFRCGFFSIDWRIDFGRMCAASADGRMASEPLAKNLSPAVGADKAGVTGLIGTVKKLDSTLIPNGAVLDVVLHPSAVEGTAGSKAVLALIKTYFEAGGMALQFNIFDPSVLRKAQEEPEKYSTLQVRLCGWNVYFKDLSKKEQDEFILQSENAAL